MNKVLLALVCMGITALGLQAQNVTNRVTVKKMPPRVQQAQQPRLPSNHDVGPFGIKAGMPVGMAIQVVQRAGFKHSHMIYNTDGRPTGTVYTKIETGVVFNNFVRKKQQLSRELKITINVDHSNRVTSCIANTGKTVVTDL